LFEARPKFEKPVSFNVLEWKVSAETISWHSFSNFFLGLPESIKNEGQGFRPVCLQQARKSWVFGFPEAMERSEGRGLKRGRATGVLFTTPRKEMVGENQKARPA
jgi:hypothetical protein